MAEGASVHLFRPAGDATEPLPLIAYLHGGSFVAGRAATHGGVAQALAETARAVVALIDYRLAPEHPLPAALDDAVAAIRALTVADDEVGDLARLAIVGDSAGGWLAVQAALALAGSGDVAISRLVLINPMISPHPARRASREDFATGYFAGTADFDSAWSLVGPWIDGGDHPDTVPQERLTKLPATVVITNDADPVRDEGEAFAERLSAAGVPVLGLRARGVTHAAWLFPKVLPEARLLLELVAGAAVSRGSASDE